VLGPGSVKVAVEAAVGFGWQRYADGFVGMPGFGASAPAGQLYEHFGITAANVAETARACLRAR
jgi:transketolase